MEQVVLVRVIVGLLKSIVFFCKKEGKRLFRDILLDKA